MKKSKAEVAKIAAPTIKRFTIEAVTKYSHRNYKSLAELLFLYPNFGKGFKVFQKMKKEDYYLIENTIVLNNRDGKLYGCYLKNGIGNKSPKKLSNNLKEGRWFLEPPAGKIKSDNKIEYDLQKIQALIDEKADLLDKRKRMLESPEEIKKKKEVKSQKNQNKNNEIKIPSQDNENKTKNIKLL